MNYTKEEKKILNELAKEILGVTFDSLDADDQDWISCEAMERCLI